LGVYTYLWNLSTARINWGEENWGRTSPRSQTKDNFSERSGRGFEPVTRTVYNRSAPRRLHNVRQSSRRSVAQRTLSPVLLGLGWPDHHGRVLFPYDDPPHFYTCGDGNPRSIGLGARRTVRRLPSSLISIFFAQSRAPACRCRPVRRGLERGFALLLDRRWFTRMVALRWTVLSGTPARLAEVLYSTFLSDRRSALAPAAGKFSPEYSAKRPSNKPLFFPSPAA